MARTSNLIVSLSKSYSSAVSVDYALQAVTASAGEFTAASGTLIFTAGQTTKTVPVTVTDEAVEGGTFRLVLSNPVNCTVNNSGGLVTIGVNPYDTMTWIGRFNWTYDLLKDTDNGYFGPTTGADAFRVPYHAKERAIIVEAPDWTHESVSETVSYWVKLEAWKYVVSDDATGLQAAWQSINDIWIPDTQGQPWGDYTPNSPAAYAPDPLTLSATPVAASTAITVGADPLFSVLQTAYGTKSVYLMHWLIDVDGDYGFHNPDGGTKNVFINNYQRGPVEDGLATITHGCYEDWTNGGGSQYGFLPIYNRSIDLYPDGDANTFSKQANYSMAGDADVRAVGNTVLAMRHNAAGVPTTVKTMAAKNGAYIQYTLYDKYFHAIPGFDAGGCHYLLSWGCGFGVGLPVEGAQQSYWGFRIGNSEIHHGYNGIDVAYGCRTGSDLVSAASGIPARWAISLDRQLELIRWLQSPEGAIAGGVSSNWRGRYETPTDGREDATFYGCYYTYSPSWFNPPSNNWAGFQGWGVQRISEVACHAAELDGDETEDSIYHRCMVILDRWIPWFFNNCTVTVEPDHLSYPINTRWTSDTLIAGVTASQAAPKYEGLPVNPSVAGPDVYEYLPTLQWPPAGGATSADYETFWSGDTGSLNPNLHCVITESGWDPGTASGFAQVLVQYCAAKKIKAGSTLSGTVPGTSILLTDVLQMACDIMDVVWRNRDAEGFGSTGSLEIPRLNDKLWIPTQFGTGAMPDGAVLANGQTTFWSMRESFYLDTEQGPAVKAWLEGGMAEGEAPSQTYHRFWNGADVAAAYAMLHHYFPATAPNPASANPGTGGAATGDGF
ncbi:glycoside hydrolase family 48 protein [Segnochrobactraceae bacterium EtOH-i3]